MKFRSSVAIKFEAKKKDSESQKKKILFGTKEKFQMNFYLCRFSHQFCCKFCLVERYQCSQWLCLV